MAALEVEETIRRLSSHKGVEGIVISSYEGVALKSTLSKDLTTKYAGLMSQLVVKARGVVRTIDAEVRLWLFKTFFGPNRKIALHSPKVLSQSLFYTHWFRMTLFFCEPGLRNMK